MAVHGALLAQSGDTRRARATSPACAACKLHVARLDDLPGELARRRPSACRAMRNNILYQFSVSHGDRCLLEGRAAVVLDAPDPQETEKP